MLSSILMYEKNGGSLHTTPDLLDEETCNYILSELTGPACAWYYTYGVGKAYGNDGFMFGHIFYD